MSLTMPQSNNDTELLEQQLTNDLKHTLKLVPQSQRELFAFELAKYLTSHNKKLELEARIDELEHSKLAIWHPDAIRYINLRISKLKAELSNLEGEKT